jgi:hypothetical protein
MKIIQRKVAKEKGVKKFFTGNPCNRGHLVERRTVNGACLLCEQEDRDKNQKEISKRFRENHKEEFNEYQRRWYHNNKESAQQTRKNYRENNPEKIKELRDKHNKLFREINPNYHPEWWANNKDKSAEYSKREYTIDSRKRWNHNNKGKKCYYTSKRRKQIIKATPLWANQKETKNIYIKSAMLQDRDGCEYHVDHIIPLLHNIVCGLHVIDNLQIITKEENLKKGNRFLVE